MTDASRQQEADTPSALLERFPRLARLGLGGRQRVPIVRQLTATDCGAACLTMTLGYFGHKVRLDEVRTICGSNRDGVSAQRVIEAGRYLGLRGRGVKVSVSDLPYLTTGAILHWEFNHYVVFEAARTDAVDIVDPAFGRRRVRMDEFRRAFTGVALLFDPGDDFSTNDTNQLQVFQLFKRVTFASSQLPQIVLTSLLIQVFLLSVPIFTGALVDRVAPRSDRHLLVVLVVGLASMVAFHFLAALVRGHLLLQLRTLLDVRLTLNFLEHLVSLPYGFFQSRSSGDLMLRLNSNATIREILTSGVLSSLLDGTMVSLYLVILFFASPSFGTIVLVMGAAEVTVFFFTRKRQRELLGQSLQVQARAAGYQVEMFAGMETLKSMGAEQRAVEHFTELFVDVMNTALRRGALGAMVDAITTTLRMGAPVAVLVFGAYLVLAGNLTLGTMLALSALAQGFLGPLSTLVASGTQLQLLGSYVERIDDVFSATPEQDRDAKPIVPSLRGSVTIDHVSFRYGPIAPLVVSDVSLEVRPGAFVALVGRSGSGKSTLAQLLLGLHRPCAGRVMFDKQDLNALDVRALRRQLGIVTQHAYIFGGSMRSAIALAEPGLSLEDVVAAAKIAQIHDEIMAMPMGYDTPILNGGASISGGQRQRLALARALVSKPAIVLLDEATSALDSITEAAVQRGLAALDCTRIVIAHRLTTILDADLIVVVEEGRVVQQGNHASLMGQPGLYAELVGAQAR